MTAWQYRPRRAEFKDDKKAWWYWPAPPDDEPLHELLAPFRHEIAAHGSLALDPELLFEDPWHEEVLPASCMFEDGPKSAPIDPPGTMVCAWCGATGLKHLQGPHKRYCSIACRGAAYKARARTRGRVPRYLRELYELAQEVDAGKRKDIPR